MTKKIVATKPVIVSSRKIAAYRAHRTMVANAMKGASKSVRTELAAKLAGYDRLLASMIPSAA